MNVTVKFVGVFRSISGKDELNMQFRKRVSMKEAMSEIVEKLPKLGRVLVNSELETATAHMLVLVNGKEISVLDGLDTRLKDGDEVVFVPVIHGG